jgi:hypothetical protein
VSATAPDPIPDPRRARWDAKPMPAPAPWDRSVLAVCEDAIDLALAYAGITDPARVALAKRRALAEIRAMFGPGARVVGG